ncbi:MAG: hypothetical protein GX334_05775 [Firmicutes bacterium]|nr:hypothetical protein [Bacillota bacterium]
MTIMAVLLFGVLIVAYETPPLYRQERYRDLIVFLIFTVLGLTLSVLLLLDVPLNSPARYIEAATTFIWNMFKK